MLLPFQQGDVVKVCVGVHVDGYMSYAGHTVVASPSASASDDAAAMDVSPNDAADVAVASVSNSDGSAAVVGGRAADAMACVRDAAVVTAALMRPGVSSDVVIRGIKHIVSCTTHSFAHPWLLSGTPDQCKGTVPSRSTQSFTYAPYERAYTHSLHSHMYTYTFANGWHNHTMITIVHTHPPHNDCQPKWIYRRQRTDVFRWRVWCARA